MVKKRVTAMVVAAATVAGGGAMASSIAYAASAHAASGAALKLAQLSVASHGKHTLLVTSSGHAVYLLTKDSAMHPLCKSSSCLATWPAATTKAMKPKLAKGIKGKLTVWTHKGMHQLVLNGHPLYTYAADSGSAANGENVKSFGGTWQLLTASGTAYTGKSSGGSGGGGSSWS
ncbi:MAG: hypothetical protein KGL16_13580 [Acidobacteriota bacterium]|nr:hypothetical protein [Acidobacteriota bacterium]